MRHSSQCRHSLRQQDGSHGRAQFVKTMARQGGEKPRAAGPCQKKKRLVKMQLGRSVEESIFSIKEIKVFSFPPNKADREEINTAAEPDRFKDGR